MDKKYLQKRNSKSLTSGQGFTDELKRIKEKTKKKSERERRERERENGASEK